MPDMIEYDGWIIHSYGEMEHQGAGEGGMEKGWLEYKMKAGLNEFSEVRNNCQRAQSAATIKLRAAL